MAGLDVPGVSLDVQIGEVSDDLAEVRARVEELESTVEALVPAERPVNWKRRRRDR